MIPVEEVLFFISDEKYTRVQTAQQEALIRTPIRELIAALDPAQFWQIHRSTLINAARHCRHQPRRARAPAGEYQGPPGEARGEPRLRAPVQGHVMLVAVFGPPRAPTITLNSGSDQYSQKMRCSSLLSCVLVSATAARMRAFCGLRSCATTQSYFVVRLFGVTDHEATTGHTRRADDVHAFLAQLHQRGHHTVRH